MLNPYGKQQKCNKNKRRWLFWEGVHFGTAASAINTVLKAML